ncbi:MAG: 4-hydroxy-tetrahydrodipicolinate reductase, partial [Oscillospiraceae bacterium]
MNIIVNGAAGRMGRVVCGLIESGRHKVAARVDASCTETGYFPTLEATSALAADCIVDFSHHSATGTLLAYAIARHLPLVIATTGQTEEEHAQIVAAATEIPIFQSANMSVGIALLLQLSKLAAKVFPDADIEIVERHHNQKLDVPSGTALLLANGIRQVRQDATYNIGRHENGKRTPQEIGIHSLRMGNVVGDHEVSFTTGAQSITLTHSAQDRSLFGEGALAAAAFLQGRQPG